MDYVNTNGQNQDFSTLVFKNEINVNDYNLLRKKVGWNVIEEAQAERGLKNSAYIISVYEDDNIVGTARVIADGGYVALIADVMVLPEYQGRGIGKKLLEHVMNYLENSITNTECLMINLMAASGKEAFYKKFGFLERPNANMGAGMVKFIN